MEITKEQAKVQQLEQERDQAVAKLQELEDLLEKLPEIFERKFSQRLAPVLELQRLLAEDNSHLRAQVEQLISQRGNVRVEFPQANNRTSITFIGLKPTTTNSLQHLMDAQARQSMATEVDASPQKLNAA